MPKSLTSKSRFEKITHHGFLNSLKTIVSKEKNGSPGWYYDVTEFYKRHPGGTVIEYYMQTGEDATLAIQQFHHHSSSKVKTIMSSFKRRPSNDSKGNRKAIKRNKELTMDFTKLYLELEEEGMFKPSIPHVLYRILEVVAFACLGCFLVFCQSSVMKLCGYQALALAQGRAAMLTHECGHRSLTGKAFFDRVLDRLLFGVFLGLSATWWERGHNKHHAMPQRLKHDVDLNTLPLLVYNAKVVSNASQGNTFLIQYQKYLFLLIDTIAGTLLWRLYIHPKYILKHVNYLECLCVVTHYVIAYHIGFWAWFISSWLMSIYLFGNFALNHTHLPVTSQPTHWVEYALMHTADVEQRPWCEWWMGYLNYQIEHHLFPNIPQFRHKKICDRVKALAEKHGIPYYVYSYKEAVLKTFKNLENVADELREMSYKAAH